MPVQKINMRRVSQDKFDPINRLIDSIIRDLSEECIRLTSFK
jgi:hypothetical protein